MNEFTYIETEKDPNLSSWIESMKDIDLTKTDPKIFTFRRDELLNIDGNSRKRKHTVKRYDSSWKGGLEPGKRALWDSGQHRFVFNVDRWMNYSRQYLHSTGHYVSKNYAITVTKITPKQMRRMKKKWRKNNDTSIVLWEL